MEWRKVIFIGILAMAWTAILSAAAFPSVAPVKPTIPHILAILSYDPTFPTSHDILDGVESVFPAANNDVYVLYMNSKRQPGPEHTESFATLVTWELTHSPRPDIILTFDDNALRFVIDRRRQLFAGIPVVFAGVNDRDYVQSLQDQADLTGVMEAVSVGETVVLMRQLFPHTPGISVIVDGTETGRADLKTLQALDLHLPLDIHDISAMPEQDFLTGLERISPAQAVLLLSAYSGYQGRVYSFHESLAMIRRASAAPLFHLWKHGIGQGLLGGKVVSQYEQARTAADLAKRVLAGQPASSIPVIRDSPNVYQFDWRELLRFGLGPPNLPPGSRIVEQPPSLYQSHPLVFWGIILASLAAASLIAILFIISRYRAKLAQRLRTENQRLEEMVTDRTRQLERANAVLATMAETDRLTGLANRRKIDSVLGEELRLVQRYGRSLAVIMLDLDHFKSVNDELGHPTGDAVLRDLAGLLRTHCRATDLVGRWGGEEFLVVCRDTDQAGAAELAEKLRCLVAEATILPDRTVTASFGVCAYRTGDTEAILTRRVDGQLYLAKQKGRNRVETD